MEEEYNKTLDEAEKLIESQKLDEAQSILDGIKVKCGRKYFLHGKLYLSKSWYFEARKQFKLAVKAEPTNPEYRQALDEMNAFKKSKEYRKSIWRQMGSTDQVAEACCLCGGEACCSGCCGAICEGCS